jgi:hypothetical protein
MICISEERMARPRSLYNVGMVERRSKVTIGSQGHVRVAGLEPIEYQVIRQGEETVVTDRTGAVRHVIRSLPTKIYTSNPSVVLIFSDDPGKLRC